jgi:hypothetical protein
MAMSLEEMYKLALNPKLFPDSRLLAVMQGHDTSLPMAVAMSAKQMRDKQETAAKGAQAQAQAGAPSVRDQMIAKSAPQAGIDQLHAPTMESMGEESMSGGGIVSMAQGGFGLDDDESDPEQDEQDELDAMMAQQGDLGGLGAGIMAVASPTAAKYSSFSMKAPSGKDSGLSDILSSAAEKHNLPKELLARIAHSESGGKADIKNPHSSAKGLFQFTDRTWKGMGGKEGEQFDPEKNADLGAAYLRQNAEGLKKALGRDPTYGEVYGAHHFGLSGIKGLLNKNPDMPIDRAVSKQVITQNPYLKGKTIGDTISFLNSKAGNGIVSLAQGGVVGLKGGSKDAVKTDDDDALEYENGEADFGTLPKEKQVGWQGPIDTIRNLYNPRRVDPLTGKAMTEGEYKAAISAPPPAQAPAVQAPAEAAPAAPVQGPPQNNPTVNAQGPQGPQGPTTPPTAPVDPMASSQSRLDKYLSNLESQHKQNQGLGAVLAGLTTAGTAGPLSSALSKGAQTGIGYVGDSQKNYNAATAQGLGAQAALDRNRVYSQHYANAAQQAAGLKYDTMLANLDKTAEDRIKNITKFGNFDLNKPDQRQKAINQIKYEMINANPGLKQHYLASSGLDELGFKKQFAPGALSDVATGTVRN